MEKGCTGLVALGDPWDEDLVDITRASGNRFIWLMKFEFYRAFSARIAKCYISVFHSTSFYNKASD